MGLSHKFMVVLRELYQHTSSHVWRKSGISEFVAENGLKQIVLLSPLLFAVFLNNLPEELDGG